MDKRDHSVPDEHHAPRTGQWLSQDRRHQHAYLHKTIKHVDANPPEKLMPVLQEFKDVVEKDSRLRMLFEEMFNQVPHSKPYLHDISGQYPTVRDFNHFILLLNHVLATAPAWTDAGGLQLPLPESVLTNVTYQDTLSAWSESPSMPSLTGLWRLVRGTQSSLTPVGVPANLQYRCLTLPFKLFRGQCDPQEGAQCMGRVPRLARVGCRTRHRQGGLVWTRWSQSVDRRSQQWTDQVHLRGDV